jgi:hypothetical protein
MSLMEKNFGECITIFIFTLIILAAYYLFTYNKTQEHFINEVRGPTDTNHWNRNKCDYILGDTYEDELVKHGITKSNNKWNLYFPCGYDETQKEIEQMPVVKSAKYFVIDSCDEMVAKEWLWINVKKHYGINTAKTLMPNSYVLYDQLEIKRFENEYDPSKIYIMKKNIQRQEGLKITQNKNEILKGFKDNYVVVQELLQNPYLISGRKTNMRFYVLVVCKENELNVYVHKDGFMYYTKAQFVKNSLDEDPNITTGYIERKVYEENPLTHDDLRYYLDNESRKGLLPTEKYIRSQGLKVSQICFNRIYHLLQTVFMSFVGRICKPNKLSKNLTFQLFGVDIAVDDELGCSIIECNKGPDMSAKDQRDSELKHEVVQDIFNLTGVVNNPKLRAHKFIRILDVKDGVIQETDL